MTQPGFLAIDRITHQASLAGHVDDGNGPLADAEVVLTDGPIEWKSRLAALHQGRPSARPDRVLTNRDGFFFWLDLPPGAYQWKASAAGGRYGAATGSVTVSSSLTTFDVTLAPTKLTGTISADNPAGPLGMARVRLVDSGEQTFTASDGTFTLSPLEPGTNRKLEVSAQRYVTATTSVTLQQGNTTTSTLTLTHS